MSLATLLNRACTITHRTFDPDVVNEFGDEIPTETPATTVCELQQRQRSETSDPGQVSKTEWLLILPAGTTIATGDTVTIDGLAYEVSGEPWPARNPRTQAASHVEATVCRTEGAAT